jgi:hypothetical protein
MKPSLGEKNRPAIWKQSTHILSGLRIRIHFIRILIQQFRMNTNPDPGL